MMAQKLFYIDTCIWLNLFKKESQMISGRPAWITARDFIEWAVFDNDYEVLYSPLVLKEIFYKLNDATLFRKVKNYLREINGIKKCEVEFEDYSQARELEKRFDFRISFYDCIHLAICKRLDAVLVTRDRSLIESARGYVDARRPEELFSPSIDFV
jgi:predicted nucleic acid-binding protein